MPALSIVNRLDQPAGFRADGTGDGDTPRGQMVDPIDLALDQRFTAAQTVRDAQNIGAGAALELIDETLERVERPDLAVRNAIALHGGLQNGLMIAIPDLLFHPR